MLKMQNISYKIEDREILKDISFELDHDENLLILGKSGTGKTTLLNILAGLIEPHAGNIYFGETNFGFLSQSAKDRFRGKNIGYIFQNNLLIEEFSVLKNIQISLSFSNSSLSKSDILELLKYVGLAGKENQKAKGLSFGEAQRLGVARAIAKQPKYIFCDEPTSSLDDDNCKKIIELLENTSRKIGSQLIIVTHDNRVKDHFKNTKIIKLK
jgi:putative ABC transport system ATP-binding protein